MTYVEQAAQLAVDSSVSAQIILGASPGDVEFMQLRPTKTDETAWGNLVARWHGRGLRSIGVVGLVGIKPQCVLKEALTAEEVSAIASAFIQYVHTVHLSALGSPSDAEPEPEMELEYDWSVRQYRLVPRHS